ncbi:ABC transporter permease [bacterium]|mgnify:FL=1|jgi:phospholipid/cholesterol/gamma-HCH transport system permease protein|nr:ABC transporter permease [bacterium]
MIAIFELLCYNSGMEITLSKYLRQSATYKVFSHLGVVFADFLDTLGKIAQIGFHVLRCIFKGEISKKELLLQCDRFGVSSLPITLSIVGMTSIIVASQVAHEMVKQGGGNFVGMLMTILIVREVGAIMSGFAITSMIGSSLASELATMRVTEQVDAIDVLGVDPIRYLFVPRVLSGIVMMPFVVILASVVGVLLGAVTSDMFAGLTYRAYFDSAWLGLYMKDLWVSLLKASVFGGTIALISCTCGFHATGGAKGVGIATTKAVVWSFISIVVLDMVFAVLFFF